VSVHEGVADGEEGDEGGGGGGGEGEGNGKDGDGEKDGVAGTLTGSSVSMR